MNETINNVGPHSSYQIDALIINFYKVSPLYSILITLSAILFIYLCFVKMMKPESLRFKMVSIEINQLTLSGILFLSSLTGYVIQVFSKFQFSVMAFTFTFIFLFIVSLMYKTTERRQNNY